MKLIKKIIKSILNLARVLCKLDTQKGLLVWKIQTSTPGLNDTQVDGYVEKHEHYSEIISESYRDLINEFKPLIENTDRNLKILDYGCGTGRYIRLFEKFRHIEVVGMDATKEMLESYTLKNFPHLKTHLLDLSTCTEDSLVPLVNTFDSAYSISVIEYVQPSKIKKTIARLCSLIKSDGLLYITFPHPDGILDIFEYLGYVKYPPIYIEYLLRLNNMKILSSCSAIHREKVRFTDSSKKENFQYIIVAKKNANI